MLNDHIYLSLLWMFYCAVHSILAAPKVKRFFSHLMKHQFKYYRIIYSLFAGVTLVLLVYIQFSTLSKRLFTSDIIYYLGVMIFLLPGLAIMILCINKYFYELSGIQALNNEPLHVTLQKDGLHKYMRHPLYSGTLMFVWGLFCMMPYLSNLIACAIMTIYVLIGIIFEEQKLRVEFGNEYIEYSKDVKMLIPKIL